jgi:hypothetical protein
MRFTTIFLALIASTLAKPINPSTVQIVNNTITLPGANDVNGTHIGPYKLHPAKWTGSLKKGGPKVTIIGRTYMQITRYLKKIGAFKDKEVDQP